MIRYLLNALLFVVPFLLYWGWLWLYNRKVGPDGEQRRMREAPFLILTMAGLLLVILSFVALVLFVDHNAGVQYVPARVEDGKLVPPEFRQ